MSVATCLEALASVMSAEGHAVQAVRLFAAAAALREAIGTPLPPAERASYDRDLALLRATLGEETFTAAWEDGLSLDVEGAIDAALTAAGAEHPTAAVLSPQGVAGHEA